MTGTHWNQIPRSSDDGNVAEKAYLAALLGDSDSGIGPALAASQSDAPSLFDHFHSIATLGPWIGTATGTTGNDVPVALSTTTAGGAITMASGSGALEAQEVAGRSVGWIPSTMGPLTFAARVKVVAATEPIDGDFSIGLASAVTHTSGVPHVVGTSSLYTTDLPVEYAGFHYSSLPTSGTLYNAAAATPIGNYIGCKTAKNGTGSLAISSGVAKDSSYHIYKVTISALGVVTCYIDGKTVYTSAATAVTLATALTPYFQVHAQASHENTMTIDWAFVGAANTV